MYHADTFNCKNVLRVIAIDILQYNKFRVVKMHKMKYAVIFVIVVDVDHALSVSRFHDNITGLAHNLTVSTTITRTRAGLDHLSGKPVFSYLAAADDETHNRP